MKKSCTIFSFPSPGTFLQLILAALLLFGILLLVALAPLLTPYSPSEMLGGAWGETDGKSLMGLDHLGRDMFTRMLYGGRVTLLVSVIGTSFAFILGTTMGLLAVICGGKVDAALSRLIDSIMSIPSLIFALVLLSAIGSSASTVVIAIAVLSSTRAFRLARSTACDIVVLDYFEAARLRKESLPWLMFREILPNIVPVLATDFGLRLCANFLLLASLSFLGLGVQPPMTDWGSMVRENSVAIHFGILAPLYPAIAITLFTVSTNLLVDWYLERQSRHVSE